MPKSFLGLGANIGDRISFIENAYQEINNIPDTKIINRSSLYETEPWGDITQGDFLNSVIEIDTNLDAVSLLKELKNIEKNLGRNKTAKWSEREIDIDLLFYGNEIIINEIMNVPHLQIENRKFVLLPMSEIAPDFIHPLYNKSIKELLQETTDKLNVIKFQTSKA